MQQNNQFTDKFRFLTLSAAKASNLRQQINRFLSKTLPRRILSRANIFEQVLNVVQDLSNLNMFYTEDSVINNNILTAQNETSVRGLSQFSGHKAARARSASGSIIVNVLPGLQLLTPSIIFDNATFKCNNNNLTYSLQNPNSTFEISTDTESFNLNLIEGIWIEQKFVADGTDLFSISLNDLNIIENENIYVYVNSELWSEYDFYDLISNTNGYFTRNGITSQVDIVFGDNIHGRKLNEGDTVLIKYLTTNGETGNLANISETVQFELLSGIYDSEGSDIDITDNILIQYDSGFSLGSFGEHIETTRALAGYNSRSSVLARPENLKVFLSKLSILSYIDVWTNEDDLVFNLLLLPNVLNRINSYSDYLYLDNTDLKLSVNERTEIKTYINTSKSQLTSSELIFNEPIFKRYAIFVYLDATYTDENNLKQKIYNSISKLMLQETFADLDLNTNKVISKSSIQNELFDLPEINRVSLEIMSEDNELARINGYYDKIETVNNGSVKEKKTVRTEVSANENPNLGFTDLGDIATAEKFEIPLLRSGFSKYNNESDPIILDKAIYIFSKQNNNWIEL